MKMVVLYLVVWFGAVVSFDRSLDEMFVCSFAVEKEAVGEGGDAGMYVTLLTVMAEVPRQYCDAVYWMEAYEYG